MKPKGLNNVRLALLDVMKIDRPEIPLRGTVSTVVFHKTGRKIENFLDSIIIDNCPPGFWILDSMKKIDVDFESYLSQLTDFQAHSIWRKNFAHWKLHSTLGQTWEYGIVVLAFLSCAIYVSGTYDSSYEAVQKYLMIDAVTSQIFVVDILLNALSCKSYVGFVTNPSTYTDIASILPYYIAISEQRVTSIMLRALKVLRLIRIFRLFRLLQNISGIWKQAFQLCLTLVCLIFIAAGCFEVLENEYKQYIKYECQHSTAATNWQPSCSPTEPFIWDSSCDCASQNCHSFFVEYDLPNQPSGVRCISRSFLDCIYYIVVTVSTVGYGDIAPSTQTARGFIVAFIMATLVIVPIQVNKLVHIFSTNPLYRGSYVPSPFESHVIICGSVGDADRLERFVVDFLHPDRFVHKLNTHVVILSTLDPTEDMRVLLLKPWLDHKVTFLVGSVLRNRDLRRASAETAEAVFLMGNVEGTLGQAETEADDAATILRTLAVSNFNLNVLCLVQVLKKEDRQILLNSRIDVVLCFDEYRTSIQARNAVCPGISTLVENMFRCFSAAPELKENPVWMQEYVHGASMESFYMDLPCAFYGCFNFNWALIAEGLYLEFGVGCLGVCNVKKRQMVFNPTLLEMHAYASPEAFYADHSTLVLLAADGHAIRKISSEFVKSKFTDMLADKYLKAEEAFPVRSMDGKKADIEDMMTAASERSELLWDTVGGRKKQGAANTTRSSGVFRRFSALRSSKGVLSDEQGPPAPLTHKLSFGRLSIAFTKPAQESKQELPQGEGQVSSAMPSSGKVAPLVPLSARSSTSTNTNANVSAGAGALRSEAERQRTTERSTSRHGSCLPAPFAATMKSLMTAEGVQNGHPSVMVDDVLEMDLVDHVIVFGCMDNLFAFMHVKKSYDDVVLVIGDMLALDSVDRYNVADAFSLVLLAARGGSIRVDEGIMDIVPMYSYLHLHRRIPSEVFFTVEMTSRSNLDVLDSTVMQQSSSEQGDHITPLRVNITAPITTFNDKILGTFTSQMSHEKSMAHSSKSMLRAVTTYMAKDNDLEDDDVEMMVIPESNKSKSTSKGSENFVQKQNIKKRRLQIDFGHHILPTFAAGKAFFPDSFDSLLSHTFFSILSPLLAEKMVSGQDHQTLYLIPIPTAFAERSFQDLFRAFTSRQILVLGLYRAASEASHSVLPYVFTSPPASAVVHQGDKVYVFCNPLTLKHAMETALNMPLVQTKNGTYGLAEDPSLQEDQSLLKDPSQQSASSSKTLKVSDEHIVVEVQEK